MSPCACAVRDSAAAEHAHHRHAHGDAEGDLGQDDRLRAIGHGRVDLDAAVHRAGVHHDRVGLGERQLLGITRTLLADPRILILDEATSSVDSLTERHIQQAVRRLMQGRTSFVIAHRLSTIKRADRLLVIHDHRIVERGTHEELMAAGGFYRQLYTLQFERPEILEESFGSAG